MKHDVQVGICLVGWHRRVFDGLAQHREWISDLTCPSRKLLLESHNPGAESLDLPRLPSHTTNSQMKCDALINRFWRQLGAWPLS